MEIFSEIGKIITTSCDFFHLAHSTDIGATAGPLIAPLR